MNSLCSAQEFAGPEQEVKTFSLVQYEDAGEKKWSLNGRAAEVQDENIKIDEVSALVFGEETILKLKAKKGSYNTEEQLVYLEDNVVAKTTDGLYLVTDVLSWDADNKNVFTEAPVSIKRADFKATGKGAICNFAARTAKLKKDITATIASLDTTILRNTDDGIRNTVITCNGPLEINYINNKAVFHNNVKVEDIKGDIIADRIDVYFNQDRQMRCLVARGNVKIINEGSVTHSKKAIYLVEQDRVILPRRPKLIVQNKSSE